MPRPDDPTPEPSTGNAAAGIVDGRRQQLLLEAALAVARERDEAAILEGIVDAAVGLTGARYAALAQYDGAGHAVRFLHRGMSPSTEAVIGRPPRGLGLLSVTAVADGPIRTADVGRHPDRVGLPAGHPRLTSFLGVPIRSGGRRHGNLYVARDDEVVFDEGDEWALATLAAFAACAIDGARLVTAERERGEALAEAAAEHERSTLRKQTLARVITAQEEERARVARDLHDEIGQSLTGVLLGLRLVEDCVRAEPLDHALAERRVSDVRALVAQALTEVRRLASALRPTVLDDLGLAAALQRLAADLAARGDVAIELDQSPLPQQERLPGPVETVVYRVVQEALTNVLRHARASHVVVLVRAAAHHVEATVTDDGCGFDVPGHGSSLGLRGMAERASLVGGTVRITSQMGQGTTVDLRIPLEATS